MQRDVDIMMRVRAGPRLLRCVYLSPWVCVTAPHPEAGTQTCPHCTHSYVFGLRRPIMYCPCTGGYL